MKRHHKGVRHSIKTEGKQEEAAKTVDVVLSSSLCRPVLSSTPKYTITSGRAWETSPNQHTATECLTYLLLLTAGIFITSQGSLCACADGKKSPNSGSKVKLFWRRDWMSLYIKTLKFSSAVYLLGMKAKTSALLKTTFHLKNTELTKKINALRACQPQRVFYSHSQRKGGGGDEGKGSKQLQDFLGFPTSHLCILHLPVHVTT